MSENENEIAKVEEAGALVSLDDLSQNTEVSKYSDEDFDALKSSSFLPRVQLMSSASTKCKQGEFPVNHYALVSGSEFNDLGAEVDVLVLGWRPKALEIDDEIITVYNPKDPEFQRIQERSEEKDSGCMWGYEFLLWAGEVGRFATFFMGSKSARREAPNVRGLINRAATLRSKFIETKKYSWQAPQVVACSTPMRMPSRSQLETELEKFNNPPQSSVERVESEGDDRAV
jgi:hypothetical protein